MAIIHLPESNFNLKEKSHFLPYLERAQISPEQYQKHIQPILQSLSGFYFAEGPQLKKMAIFPKTRFMINGLSMSKTLEYALGETDLLRVPIQDGYSFNMESPRKGRLNPDADHLVRKGLAVAMYDKQTGSINISRRGGSEIRLASLEGISRESMWVPTGSLTDEAIDKILD